VSLPAWVKNALLVLTSFAFTVAVIELATSLYLVRLLPLKLHAALPRGVRVLAQSSKRGVVPRDYVAILGDSYAQGSGDWLLEVDQNANPPFHSAHVLHERSGRDVVSFGASGAGSLRALVTEPVAGLRYLDRLPLLRPGPPSDILVYFYEGNDLVDNALDIRLRYQNRYDPARLRDRSYFRSFIEQAAIAETPIGRDAAQVFPWDDLILVRTVIRMVGATLLHGWPEPRPTTWTPGRVNRAWIAGRQQAIPDGLQSPALELDDAEIELGEYVFGESLNYLRAAFPTARIGVVYLPSPLSSYRLASDEVVYQAQIDDDGDGQYEDHQGTAPAALVARRSDAICAAVRAFAEREGVGFRDARLALWPQAAAQAIHGPRDWKHFNRVGHEALAGVDQQLLDALARGHDVLGACGSLVAWQTQAPGASP
jgi:hypothetical protein